MTERNFNKKIRKKRIWRSVITTLAAISVFITTYALIIPAITWEKTLVCELEEHLHTDDCYNSKGELKCNKIEHRHTAECYDAPKAFVSPYQCGKIEHQHSADCYFEDGTLKCTLQEHTHTDLCLYMNVARVVPLFASAGDDPLVYIADPDTSGIESWFKVGGNFLPDNDGRIAADKSVSTFDPRNNQFGVVLSALGQTYRKELPENDRIHPDVVFILDMSNSMFINSIPDGKGGKITRAEAVVNSVNKSIDDLLAADPETRIGIVAYGNECTDDRLYLELGNYKLTSGSGWLIYDDNYTKASNGTRLLHIPLSEIPSGGKSYPLELYGTTVDGYTLNVKPNNSKTYTVTATKNSNSVSWTVEKGTQTNPKKSDLKKFGSHTAQVVNDGTYLDFYYHYDDKDDPAHVIAVNPNLKNADGSTDGIVYAPFIGIDGTYTQAGIVAAADMMINNAKENRVPSIILASDGEPTYAYAYDTNNPQELLDAWHQDRMETRNKENGGYGLPGDGKFGNGGSGEATQAGNAYDTSGNLQGTNRNNSRGALMGYYTIRTAMYAKDAVHDAYYAKFLDYYKSLTDEDGQRLFSDEEAEEQTVRALDSMFFSVGPGVTTLYGKTVLGPGTPTKDDPTKTNLELSKTDTTKSLGDITPARLYEILTKETQKEGQTDLNYVDYADYSIAGDLTAPQIDEGMKYIVNRIAGVPRPVVTTKETIGYTMIKPDAFVTFTDTLGEDMKVTGNFTLTYGGETYQAVLAEENGILDAGSLYEGCHYQRYAFTGYVTEPSTDTKMNLRDIRVYQITKDDGIQVVLWQFPSELLPVIYHKYNYNGAGYIDDEFYGADPIRLNYNVGVDGSPKPGKTYYSNSTEEIASLIAQFPADNPYYDSDYQTEENAKTQNRTGTESYSFKSTEAGNGHLEVDLGNNGKLRVPLTIAVHKIWNDTATTHDPITVHLYGNGVDTGMKVVLNDSNHWTAKFPDTLDTEDQNGDPINYTVREDVPEGYTVIGENTEPDWIHYETKTTTPASWKIVTSMTAGNTYRIHFGNASGVVLKDNNGNVGVGTSSGNTATDTSEQWEVVNDGGGLRLQNVKSGKYLGLDSGKLTYSSSYNYTSFALNNDRIRLTRSRWGSTTTLYLQLNGSTLSVVSPSNSGTAVVVEQLEPEKTETTEETEFGFELTNKPLELSISAEKIWGPDTDDLQKPVELKVYEKNSAGTVSEIGTMQLTAAGNWKASFTKSPAAATSSYYLSEINTDGFVVNYSGGEVENLTYNGKTFLAVKVDAQHAADITVTNTRAWDELPATGGSGIVLLYVIGALLMLGALIIGDIHWRRRERREES